MKIVQVNKHFFPEYGTERYWFGLMDELKARGHEVIPFAMQHPKNRKSKYSKYFVSNIDASATRVSWKSIKAFGRAVYSLEARKKFAQLLNDTKPDVVHVHTIHHHISPSILRQATKRGIPVVQTLHDYKLVCPAYLFPMRDGKPCTQCRRGNWLHIIKHRAHKNSLVTTATLALESFIHSALHIYERHTFRFIAPSQDMASRLVELGVSPAQLSIVPHYLDTKTWKASRTFGKGILFAGRIMPDRGLDHVLHVAKRLPAVPVTIAGDGPDLAALEAKIKMLGVSNVKLVGRLSGEKLRKAFRAARVVFFPSQTLDTFGLTVLEAMASRKPVVATRLGAVLDLVRDGENGVLYDPDKPDAAVESIKKLLSDDTLARTLGKNARKTAEDFSLEKHYGDIVDLYAKAIANSIATRLPREFSRRPLEVRV